MKKLVLLVLVLLVSGIKAQQSKNWMSYIDDDRYISRISIPGTHDSGAVHGDVLNPISTISNHSHITQYRTIANQLNEGVRFLDIRSRYDIGSDMSDPAELYLAHGPILYKTTLHQVLAICKKFLKTNPSEAIIFSLKFENNPLKTSSGNDIGKFIEKTNELLNKYKNIFYTGSAILPKLKDVRGKIILLNRTSSNLYVTSKNGTKKRGINAYSSGYWPDNTTDTTGNIRIQDIYKVGFCIIPRTYCDTDAKDNKIMNIKDFILFSSNKKDSQNILYLNFTSGTNGMTAIPNIPSIYEYINPKIINYLRESKKNSIGVIITDHMTESFAEEIYSKNVLKTKPIQYITLYQHSNYKGEKIIINEQEKRYLQHFNDRASSIKVKKGYLALLFEDIDYRGKYKLAKNYIGSSLNDKVSSVRRWKDVGNWFFQDAGYVTRHRYQNREAMFIPDKTTSYSGSEFYEMVGGNDELSSMKVGKGYTITLYQHTNYKGEKKTFKAGWHNLHSYGWGDRASSMKITKIKKSKSNNTNITPPTFAIDYTPTDSNPDIESINEIKTKIYPNPAISKVVLEINSTGKQEVKIEIINAQGVLAKQNYVRLIPGINKKEIQLNSHFPNGNYIVKVHNDNQEINTHKLVIKNN